jgi:hypothetical protein
MADLYIALYMLRLQENNRNVHRLSFKRGLNHLGRSICDQLEAETRRKLAFVMRMDRRSIPDQLGFEYITRGPSSAEVFPSCSSVTRFIFFPTPSSHHPQSTQSKNAHQHYHQVLRCKSSCESVSLCLPSPIPINFTSYPHKRLTNPSSSQSRLSFISSLSPHSPTHKWARHSSAKPVQRISTVVSLEIPVTRLDAELMRFVEGRVLSAVMMPTITDSLKLASLVYPSGRYSIMHRN